ncbi:arsenate reductase (glutaredoxin) [Porticoccaceae bacterium]|jgi:arsenate reductase|nr:arsenate reductase (glutaredoxin) [Porticoccaceae bacterium]
MPTIYHNPRCSKSRQTLSLLQDQGIAPEIVLYLETPPSPETITLLLKKLGFNARQLLRRGEQEYKDQNLANASLSEQQLIAAMAKYPKLIERPIVINGDRAAIGRPPESVLEIL